MFGKGKWVNKLCIEGEKEAQLVARIEGLPEANPDFDSYPVDMTLPKRKTFIQACKKAIEYSKHNIYNMFYKDERRDQDKTA